MLRMLVTLLVFSYSIPYSSSKSCDEYEAEVKMAAGVNATQVATTHNDRCFIVVWTPAASTTTNEATCIDSPDGTLAHMDTVEVVKQVLASYPHPFTTGLRYGKGGPVANLARIIRAVGGGTGNTSNGTTGSEGTPTVTTGAGSTGKETTGSESTPAVTTGAGSTGSGTTPGVSSGPASTRSGFYWYNKKQASTPLSAEMQSLVQNVNIDGDPQMPQWMPVFVLHNQTVAVVLHNATDLAALCQFSMADTTAQGAAPNSTVPVSPAAGSSSGSATRKPPGPSANTTDVDTTDTPGITIVTKAAFEFDLVTWISLGVGGYIIVMCLVGAVCCCCMGTAVAIDKEEKTAVTRVPSKSTSTSNPSMPAEHGQYQPSYAPMPLAASSARSQSAAYPVVGGWYQPYPYYAGYPPPPPPRQSGSGRSSKRRRRRKKSRSRESSERSMDASTDRSSARSASSARSSKRGSSRR